MKGLAPLALLLAGCVQSAPAEELPARLVAPDAAARAELRSVVAAAIGQADVALADDALMADGNLTLERTPRQDPLGHRLPGRDLGEPERFRLLHSGGECVLLHVTSERRWVLEQARCEPL